MAAGKKILYFIRGGTPTEADKEAALSVGTLTFRNALAVSEFDYVEPCDGVAGAVPDVYLKKYARVDSPPEVKAEPVVTPSAPTPPPPPPPPPPPTPVLAESPAATPTPPWASK